MRMLPNGFFFFTHTLHRRHTMKTKKEKCDFCQTRNAKYFFRGEYCCQKCKDIMTAPGGGKWYAEHINRVR